MKYSRLEVKTVSIESQGPILIGSITSVPIVVGSVTVQPMQPGFEDADGNDFATVTFD